MTIITDEKTLFREKFPNAGHRLNKANIIDYIDVYVVVSVKIFQTVTVVHSNACSCCHKHKWFFVVKWTNRNKRCANFMNSAIGMFSIHGLVNNILEGKNSFYCLFGVRDCPIAIRYMKWWLELGFMADKTAENKCELHCWANLK